MATPTLITELSTTAAANAPAGSDSPSTLDDIQRAHASFIAQLRDADALKLNASAVSAFGLTLIDDASAAAARATLGTVAATDFSSSLAASGYQKLPSGLIIQWGQVASSASGEATVTFPIAFVSAVRTISVQHMNGVVSSPYMSSVATFSSTNFTFSVYTPAGARVAQLVGWIAIGN